MVFRWYRSCWTDLHPVTLSISDPFTVVDLTWNTLKTAYESRPVVLPFDSFSGTLRVNGVERTIRPFRVNRYTFEVLLFLQSSSYSAVDEPDLARESTEQQRLWAERYGRLRAEKYDRLRWYDEARFARPLLYDPYLDRYVPRELLDGDSSMDQLHREVVTKLAGVSLLTQLGADVRQLQRRAGDTSWQLDQLEGQLLLVRNRQTLATQVAAAVRRQLASLRRQGGRQRFGDGGSVPRASEAAATAQSTHQRAGHHRRRRRLRPVPANEAGEKAASSEEQSVRTPSPPASSVSSPTPHRRSRSVEHRVAIQQEDHVSSKSLPNVSASSEKQTILEPGTNAGKSVEREFISHDLPLHQNLVFPEERSTINQLDDCLGEDADVLDDPLLEGKTSLS